MASGPCRRAPARTPQAPEHQRNARPRGPGGSQAAARMSKASVSRLSPHQNGSCLVECLVQGRAGRGARHHYPSPAGRRGQANSNGRIRALRRAIRLGSCGTANSAALSTTRKAAEPLAAAEARVGAWRRAGESRLRARSPATAPRPRSRSRRVSVNAAISLRRALERDALSRFLPPCKSFSSRASIRWFGVVEKQENRNFDVAGGVILRIRFGVQQFGRQPDS